MESLPPEKTGSGPGIRSLSYRLKMELRRLERDDKGDTPYAGALRRVLRATSQHDRDSVLRMIEDEIRELEQRGNDPIEVDALRQAVSFIEPGTQSRRELFSYYLRKMEQEGRGDEPFAQALRRALDAPDGPSVEDLFESLDPPGNRNIA